MIFAIAMLVVVAAVYFEVFESFAGWAMQYEEWEIDELILVPVVFGLAFGVYA